MDFSTQIIERKKPKKFGKITGIELKRTYKRYIYAIFIFAFCMLLLISCANDIFFESDEGEIYSKGIAIVQGEVLYRDNASQHMPVMYYIAALFHLLGASTVCEFRICFYVLFSLIWGLCAIWYDDKIPVISLFLCPALYIVMISRVYYGTSILSEHGQAIGFNILFYELICYYLDDKVRTGQLIRISLAVFLAFGSAFTSIFPIFFLVLTVVAIDMDRYFLKKGNRGRVKCRQLLRRYCSMVIAVAIPFVVLCVYYLFMGSLDDFYYWAYKFNVTIYANYQPTGGSVIQSLFGGFNYMLDPLRGTWTDSASIMFAEFTVIGFLSVIAIGVLLRSPIVPIGLVLMVNGCETRGSIIGFHSMHAIMLQCAIISYALGGMTSKLQTKRLQPLMLGGLLVIILLPFKDHFRQYKSALVLNDPLDSTFYHCVDVLTEDGERLGSATLNEGLYIASRTVPASIVSPCVKWMWEGAGEKAMEQLRTCPPNLYNMDENYCAWNYPLADYAPELIAFVHENYKPLSKYGCETVFVLNSYYDEACKILKNEGFFEVILDEENAKVYLVCDSNVDLHNLRVAVWSEINDQDDLIWYSPKQRGNRELFVINLGKHRTKGRYFVDFYKENEDDTASLVNRLTFTIDSLPDYIECITE